MHEYSQFVLTKVIFLVKNLVGETKKRKNMAFIRNLTALSILNVYCIVAFIRNDKMDILDSFITIGFFFLQYRKYKVLLWNEPGHQFSSCEKYQVDPKDARYMKCSLELTRKHQNKWNDYYNDLCLCSYFLFSFFKPKVLYDKIISW